MSVPYPLWLLAAIMVTVWSLFSLLTIYGHKLEWNGSKICDDVSHKTMIHTMTTQIIIKCASYSVTNM